jgi:hypothetical protein
MPLKAAQPPDVRILLRPTCPVPGSLLDNVGSDFFNPEVHNVLCTEEGQEKGATAFDKIPDQRYYGWFKSGRREIG